MPLTILVLYFLIREDPLFTLSPCYYAGFFFIAASILDALDGYYARSRKQVTETGKLLDPIADKVLVLISLVALTKHGLSWAIFIIIAVREFAISYGREWIDSQEKLRGCIAVDTLGKLKMVTQCFGVTYAIFHLPYFNEVMWVAVFFTVISGIDYGIKLRKAVKKIKSNQGAQAVE